MYNRVNQILEQYPFVVNQTYKGRGALICDTDQGLKILKEYRGSEARADFLYKMLMFLQENGCNCVDRIVKTKEEKSIAVDVDETAYMVRDWYEGRECDTRSREDILRSIRRLAVLHNSLRSYQGEIPEFLIGDRDALLLENQKHCRELKKVRNYITGKKKKNDFEMAFIKNCNYFMEQAQDTIEIQEREKEETLIRESSQGNCDIYGICHGDFNQHNILFSREGCAIVNFEKAVYDVQVGDLSNFMRKILEKHNWNLGLGSDMLNAYEKVRKMDELEWKQLYIRLSYPEKFWKISNHYYNSSKAWVCGRNLEKLQAVVGQEEEKKRFLQTIFHNLLF